MNDSDLNEILDENNDKYIGELEKKLKKRAFILGWIILIISAIFVFIYLFTNDDIYMEGVPFQFLVSCLLFISSK